VTPESRRKENRKATEEQRSREKGNIKEVAKAQSSLPTPKQ
jgi:hypothetical protein